MHSLSRGNALAVIGTYQSEIGKLGRRKGKFGANEEWSEPSLGRCMRERESRELLPDKRIVATYVQRVRYVTNAYEIFPAIRITSSQ